MRSLAEMMIDVTPPKRVIRGYRTDGGLLFDAKCVCGHWGHEELPFCAYCGRHTGATEAETPAQADHDSAREHQDVSQRRDIGTRRSEAGCLRPVDRIGGYAWEIDEASQAIANLAGRLTPELCQQARDYAKRLRGIVTELMQWHGENVE